MSDGIIPLADMTMEELREAYARVSRRPAPLLLSRKKLIELIESCAPKPPRRKHVPYIRKQRRAVRMKSRGVGRYVRELLTTASPDGVGLSYAEILKRALKKFPDSSVDPRHIAWYATSMRAEGKTIPVVRERSRWR